VSVTVVGVIWAGIIGGVVAWGRRRPDETSEQARDRRQETPRRRREEWRATSGPARAVILVGLVLFLVGGVGVRVVDEPTWWGWAALVAALLVLLAGFGLDAARRRRRS
jgi:Na+/glutamate symporter